MTKNVEVLKALISTNLHIAAEHQPLTHKEITDTAINLRKCLSPFYPVTDKEWETVLRDIARYADCLL